MIQITTGNLILTTGNNPKNQSFNHLVGYAIFKKKFVLSIIYTLFYYPIDYEDGIIFIFIPPIFTSRSIRIINSTFLC
jgi:hypothetical protein